MFRNKEKPESMTDKDYSTMLKEILDKFADGMAKFEAMKKSIHDEVVQKSTLQYSNELVSNCSRVLLSIS